MKRVLTSVLFFLLPLMALAQMDVTDSMNSETFWQGIAFKDYKTERLQNKKNALPVTDTMFMVASNRATLFGEIRFMGEDRGNDHLNYFLVFLKNGQWNVWHTSFKTAMNAMSANDRDWLVYTEGFGKIFTTGLYRGFSMTMQYGLNVLYLDYPSFSTSRKMMGNYYFALDNARQSGIDFAPVFDTLKLYRETGRMGNGRLTFFFHSMGNNMIREMVRQGKIGNINGGKWVDNLVLNSACVPMKGHAKWVDQIGFANRTYINYNPKDATLSGAHFMSLRTQLGQAQDNDRSTQAVYVNFHPLCNRNHSNFLSLLAHKSTSPAAVAYYQTLFHGNSAPLDDATYFKASQTHKMDYTILEKNIQPELKAPEVSNKKSSADAAGEAPARSGTTSTMLH